MTLTPASPRAQLGVPAGEPRDTLLIRVTTVNQLRQAWAINLSTRLADGRVIVLASINPYPIDDDPGAFMVPLPDLVQESIAGQGGVLIAELEPSDGQVLREPLTVTITVAWAESR